MRWLPFAVLKLPDLLSLKILIIRIGNRAPTYPGN
jgi:hypothetical protein